MENLFEKICDYYMSGFMRNNNVREINRRIELNAKTLGLRLSKRERKLLLRIIDDKDLIIEQSVLNSFIRGFKIGTKFGYEINQN